MIYLVHVAGWEPYDLQELALFFQGSICTLYTDPVRHLITADAGSTVDYLYDLDNLLIDECMI